MATIDITIHASIPLPFNIGGGNPPVINAETFGGTIPGIFDGTLPGTTLILDVGDTLIVRLINDLPYPTGIHWHGIELENYSDGTEVTQSEVPGAPLQVLGNGVPAGGTFLYKFKVPKPGIFWFHPHHHHSTNRVFRGQYGMLVVKDADEDTLVSTGVLPSAANTHRLVLSDITVCKAVYLPGEPTYVDPTTIPTVADRPEWLSGSTSQNGPTPLQLCQTAPLDDDGMPVMPVVAFAAGEIPNTFKMVQAGTPTVEGQTVLTNGVNVGGRKGIPLAAPGPLGPGALDPGYTSITAQPGQGIRFQIANTATTRYFRLILTTAAGVQIPLVRVGGEGGILNDAIVEGGMLGTYNTKYSSGEILLPAASRADVVAVIPLGTENTTCTMWTRDFERIGPGFSGLPTVPVLHIDIGNVPVALFPTPTGLKSTLPLNVPLNLGPTQPLGPATDPNPFLDASAFVPAKIGAPPGKLTPPTVLISTQEIQLTAGAGMTGINGVAGSFDLMPYTTNPHIGSTRYAKAGNILQFKVVNMSGAHHPFHLHGFSFHPVSIEPNGGPVAFTWPANATEYRDTFDIPAMHTVTFKVHISPRPLADGSTVGGALGRWLFHCHIFFHAHHGMISELVITDPDGTGSEKPNVNVAGSWAYAVLNGPAERHGTFSHPDGDAVTLSASLGTVVDTGGGTWSWTHDTTGMPAQIQYVYITATDTAGRQDQAVFRLKIGAPDDGSDNGDPHIYTVDGKRYDFQAVGEFTLLRDREGLEIQVRQWPVETATPVTDPYSGLTACVSVNTAVAARVGQHRIAYQPGRDGSQLQFFLDGKPARLSIQEGIDLGSHRVTAYSVAGGGTAIRVDYENNAVLTITPYFWTSNNIWLLNIDISHTQGDEGIMGSILEHNWLPTLPSGATVGPMPTSLNERYVALYQTFANAWRLTDASSLFVYAPGTSTATFTDYDWPPEQPPCNVKPQFQLPGAPLAVNIPIAQAEQICQAVTIGDLHRDCVIDVATTGDEVFAQGYLLSQDLRLYGSAVQIVGDKPRTRPGESAGFTAIVSPLKSGRPTPTGSVTFSIDGAAAGPPVKLDGQGRAYFTSPPLGAGEHKIRGTYSSDGGEDGYHSSTSPNLTHMVKDVPGDTGESKYGCHWTLWIWILIILVLIAIAAWVYFR